MIVPPMSIDRPVRKISNKHCILDSNSNQNWMLPMKQISIIACVSHIASYIFWNAYYLEEQSFQPNEYEKKNTQINGYAVKHVWKENIEMGHTEKQPTELETFEWSWVGYAIIRMEKYHWERITEQNS